MITDRQYSPHTWYMWHTLATLQRLNLSPYSRSLLLAIEVVDRLYNDRAIEVPAYTDEVSDR